MFYVAVVCLLSSLSGLDCLQLLFSSDHAVFLVDTQTNYTSSMDVAGPRTPHSLDYHYTQGYLYFVVHDDSGMNSFIKRSSIPFKKQEIPLDIESSDTVDEVAVNWVSDRIYWTSRSKAEVHEANLDGTDKRLVLRRQDLLSVASGLSDKVQLYNLLIDPHSRVLFMVADETNSLYSRSFLVMADDRGHNLRLVQNVQLPTLSHIALDVDHRRLYVYGTQDKTISVYSYLKGGSLDNSDYPTITKRLSDRLQVLADSMYWVDPLIGPENIYNSTLNFNEKTSASVNHKLLYVPNKPYIQAFKVYDRGVQPSAGCDKAVCPPDNSSATSTTSSTSQKSCQIPEHPENRYIRYDCPTCTLSTGDSVAHAQLIAVSCTPGNQLVQGFHYVTDKAYVACQHGAWESAIPRCYKLCPPLTSITLDLECWQGPNIVNCNEPMLPNTTVKYRCKQYYELSNINQPNVFRCSSSGAWSRELPQCTPACGQSSLNSFEIKPTIVGGSASRRGELPWHAGLYHNKTGRWELACGGTLISSRAILSAAHCVTSPCVTCKPPVMDPSAVKVSLGKSYRDWYQSEDTEVKTAVKSIHVHPNYVGSSQNYGQDIAILILESDVPVSGYVMPACVDFFKSHLSQLTSNNLGYVVGWGNTEACSSHGNVCDTRSDILKYGRTSIVDFNTCFATTQSIKGFPATRLTPDKYCAGNGSETVVQQGDSGGGLTFVFEGLHYVYGIVSVKLQLQLENNLFYSFGAFTSVPAYMDWINSKLY